jgi:hypothetical protein
MDGYRKFPARFECVFTRIVLIGDMRVDAVTKGLVNWVSGTRRVRWAP